MEKVKKSFINQVIESVKNFDFYKKISEDKVSQSFKYFIFLILIYTVVATIGISYSICNSIKEAQNFVINEIKEINYEDGKLIINNNEYCTFYNNTITINTSEDANIDDYQSKVVIGREELSIKTEECRFKFKYENFIFKSFNQNNIIEALNVKNYIVLIIVVSLLGAFIALAISTLLDILVIALIGLIISNITGNNTIKFKNTFNISVHAITLPVILGMIYFIVNIFTGFNIKYFSTMYTLIACIYMVTAILLINSEKKSN